MTEDEPKLTGHSYDGIQEFDNPLPSWWSAVFVLSVVFALFYLIHYHGGGQGVGRVEAYDAEAAEVFEMRFAELGELQPDAATIQRFLYDRKWLSVGRAVFKTNCVSCHGAQGQGLVGPNLTDDHWKNVTRIEDIAKVISNGAAGGAMPAWRNRLSHVNQIVLTAAYVASLRGTSPPDAREAEGVVIPPWTPGDE